MLRKYPNKQRDGGKLSSTCLPYNGNYNKQQQASEHTIKWNKNNKKSPIYITTNSRMPIVVVIVARSNTSMDGWGEKTFGK